MTKGKIWKFGNNVDTDQIISSQYIMLPDVEEMKKYTFESLSPDFAKSFKPGDIIVGGYNFGSGSSREQAPLVLRELGTATVIARSYARIFFRNSINIGLPLIICEELFDDVAEGSELGFSFEQGEIIYNGKTYKFNKFPEHILRIIEHGGLINYINSI